MNTLKYVLLEALKAAEQKTRAIKYAQESMQLTSQNNLIMREAEYVQSELNLIFAEIRRLRTKLKLRFQLRKKRQRKAKYWSRYYQDLANDEFDLKMHRRWVEEERAYYLKKQKERLYETAAIAIDLELKTILFSRQLHYCNSLERNLHYSRTLH